MTEARARPGVSLSRRLVLAALVWLAAALLLTGIALAWLFAGHIERRFDASLADHAEELVAATEVTVGGDVSLTWRPADPRFGRPLSGWYWQIREAGGPVVAASDSLAGDELAPPAAPRPVAAVTSLAGPGGAPLRARVQAIAFPDAPAPLEFVVAGPASDIERDIARFSLPMAGSLAALGLTLALAILGQVRFGLAPLKRLRQRLAELRGGSATGLGGDWPAEVAPLVGELDGLLAQHADRLARARREAADLAHALKTPISVLRNELETQRDERGRLMREQLALVNDRLERHLSRARAAGSSVLPGARASVAEALADLGFGLERLHAARGIRLETDVEPPSLAVHADVDDLAEMLGNLLDNAFKWARRRVLVRARASEGRVLLRIEDDGPGIAGEARAEVLRRGRRLDESVPGSGLGLAITEELASACGGSLSLHDAAAGGLAVELELALAP